MAKIAGVIQSSLLQWFRKNRRNLPWRKTRDPYAIWISEIMLQQTQVKTVIPYYERWMKQFPDVRKLSKAPLSRILKLWEGLGYYSRARNLHETAKIVDRKWRGKFPDSSDQLQSLPGIGRYTAGAIASIAFNKPEPILDGNVKRVLSRIFALKEPIDTPRGEKKMWEISETLIVGAAQRRIGRPHRGALTDRANIYGDFNQSLMELGALVCLPENPDCAACPVENDCAAHRLKKENIFPIKARRQKLEKLNTFAAVIWNKGRILLQRQPVGERWGGLWMFPQWIHRNGKSGPVFLEEKVKSDLGLRIKNWRSRTEIKHGFTKYDVRLRVFEGNTTQMATQHNMKWLKPNRLSMFPLPSPHQKIAREIQTNA